MILGVVQGLSEFIPISSKGHLVLVPYLLGWDPPGLATTVALHIGTLGAVLVYFRGELWLIVRGVLGVERSPAGLLYRRLGWLIVGATVPVSVVGLLLRERLEPVFELPLPTAVMLLATAALLWGGEAARARRVTGAGGAPAAAAVATSSMPARSPSLARRVWSGDWRGAASAAVQPDDAVPGKAPAPLEPVGDLPEPAAEQRVPLAATRTGRDLTDPEGRDLTELGWRQAAVVGAFQVLALLPGVSRSGSTIVGGLFSGLTREAATRFSFLLSIPALVGATVLSAPAIAEAGGPSAGELALGIAAAFGSGYLAIRFLLALVSRDRLTGFAKYLVAASVVGVLGYLMLGPPSVA